MNKEEIFTELESQLRDELDRAGAFISNDRLSAVLSRFTTKNPLYHFATGVLAARTAQGENHVAR